MNSKYFFYQNKKFFFDDFYNIISLVFYKLCYSFYFLFDKGILELFGGFGASMFISNFSKDLLKNNQTGFYFHYSIFMLYFLFFILILFLIKII